MTNQELANKFNILGKLLELHGENQFKIRSYTNAYLNIKKWHEPIIDLTVSELATIQGIGKAIQAKILELAETGEMQTLNRYLDKTPPGIVQMLSIKGFGPKKIKVLWEEMEIETLGELMIAINENRLVDVKGFGQKTQAALKEQLEYHLDSQGKLKGATALGLAHELLSALEKALPKVVVTSTGALARKCNVIDRIDLLTTADLAEFSTALSEIPGVDTADQVLNYKGLPVLIHKSRPEDLAYESVRTSSTPEFWAQLNIKKAKYKDEAEVFIKNGHPYYIPEYREPENLPFLEDYTGENNIVTRQDIKGCIHNHSTYSDGMQTVSEMVDAAQNLDYEYFVITDHSKTAIYANGLSIDRLYQQLEEIRTIDQGIADCKLFSGIESDILADGSLDYPDEVLAELDVVVASIHSGLRMDEKKATKRLIRAIENPYTSILGHPTGRLLLSRPAYPINHSEVIAACAEYNVAIELNANPSRLDMDWRWINDAVSKGVYISINPDAHSIGGIEHTVHGVDSARKAGLPIAYCLNALGLDEFEEWLKEQHEKREE